VDGISSDYTLAEKGLMIALQCCTNFSLQQENKCAIAKE
jgi:hypothetical protein